jgi:hypothetical protein
MVVIMMKTRHAPADARPADEAMREDPAQMQKVS